MNAGSKVIILIIGNLVALLPIRYEPIDTMESKNDYFNTDILY